MGKCEKALYIHYKLVIVPPPAAACCWLFIVVCSCNCWWWYVAHSIICVVLVQVTIVVVPGTALSSVLKILDLDRFSLAIDALDVATLVNECHLPTVVDWNSFEDLATRIECKIGKKRACNVLTGVDDNYGRIDYDTLMLAALDLDLVSPWKMEYLPLWIQSTREYFYPFA